MIIRLMLLAASAGNPPSPKYDALFGCMIEQITRQIGTAAVKLEPAKAEAIAHTAAVACDALFDPATEEQLSWKGNDPVLAARIEAEEAARHTPEETFENARRVTRIVTELEFAGELAGGSFNGLAQRFHKVQKPDVRDK